MDAQSQWTGLDAARLERITDHLERNYIGPQKIMGAQIAVARRGQVAYRKSFGSMDLERSKPMADDAIFRIYSMTKPITSVALMILVEEGALGLDDDVATHIPSWKKLGVYAGGMPSLLPVRRRPSSPRFRISCTMQCEGQSRSGCSPPSFASSLRGPHDGLARLSSTSFPS